MSGSETARLVGAPLLVLIGLGVVHQLFDPAPLPAAGVVAGGLLALLAGASRRGVFMAAVAGGLVAVAAHLYSHVAEGRVDSLTQVSGHALRDAALGGALGTFLLLVGVAVYPPEAGRFRAADPATRPSRGERPELLYRYGPIAWLWRVLAVGGFLASASLVVLAARFGDWIFLAIAAPLALPTLVLPWMLAIQIDLVAKDEIIVTNLLFLRRRVHRDALGRPRVRHTAAGLLSQIPAPRAWIPVRRGWPIYVDLYAEMPHQARLRSFLRLPRK